MDSADTTATKKQAKDHKNLRTRSDKKSSDAEDASFQRLRNLFLKTEEMKQESKTRNEQMENQFKELQDRLTNSSGYLNQIKKSIENIKFSYQRDITDLEKVTEENREDIDRQIEEIRAHIGQLQSAVKVEKPKPQTYQEALNDVICTFQNIAQGKY
ncbi:hypothetical protein TcasGA2_TC011232 [Tribolium castaneum]|uniref:Uncharacterized protein n=1 Tax=Tribolium castaneum TaxID=7070 RepID=D6X3I0_TRICA|nr:hypothetical protein TcasGA2_TC011232 [Tribolium castaneum]